VGIKPVCSRRKVYLSSKGKGKNISKIRDSLRKA